MKITASLLANVSFVCGCACVLFTPFCIPGIACGHFALARMRRDAETTGRGWAIAGLVLGYLAVVATVIMVLGAHGTKVSPLLSTP